MMKISVAFLGVFVSMTAVGSAFAGEDGDCKGKACVTACDKQSRVGDCLNAGEGYRLGSDGLPEDVKKAAPYLKKACDKESGEACFRLGELYKPMGGLAGDEGDDAKVVPLFVRACDNGKGEACDQLAAWNEKGEYGVKKDHKKAVELMGKGCAAEDYQVWTCNALKALITKKDVDAMKVAADWKDACGKKNEVACTGQKRLAAAK